MYLGEKNPFQCPEAFFTYFLLVVSVSGVAFRCLIHFGLTFIIRGEIGA
jgi:hypothetical protein